MFNVGDRVICVDDGGWDGIITKGKEYAIVIGQDKEIFDTSFDLVAAEADVPGVATRTVHPWILGVTDNDGCIFGVHLATFEVVKS